MHILEAALVSNLALKPRARNVPPMNQPMIENPPPRTALPIHLATALAVIGIVMATLDIAT